MKNQDIVKCVNSVVAAFGDDWNLIKHEKRQILRDKWYDIIEEVVAAESDYARSQYECGC